MKITTSQLKQIIAEEVQKEKLRRIIRESVRAELMNEGLGDFFADMTNKVKNMFGLSKEEARIYKGMKEFATNAEKIQNAYKKLVGKPNTEEKLSMMRKMIQPIGKYSDQEVSDFLQGSIGKADVLKDFLDRYEAGTYEKQPFSEVEKSFERLAKLPKNKWLTATDAADNILRMADDSQATSDRLRKQKEDAETVKRKEEREAENTRKSRRELEDEKFRKAREEEDRLRRKQAAEDYDDPRKNRSNIFVSNRY